MYIAYSSLQIELTRRCLQNCKHCCRGKMQNVDLSKEIIDAFLDYNPIYSITRLLFSGGEPTLNGKMLLYFIKRIIEKGITVYSFDLSINGLHYDEDFVTALNLLHHYCDQNNHRKHKYYGFLIVSQSQFHLPYDQDVINQLKDLPYFLYPDGITFIPQKLILPYGNALRNHLTDQLPNLEDFTNYEKGLKITEYNGNRYFVIPHQYISSNGNVLMSSELSYDLMDTYCIGNVMQENILEMYEKPCNKLLQKKI